MSKMEYIMGEIRKCRGCGKYFKVWTTEQNICQFCTEFCYEKYQVRQVKHDKTAEEERRKQDEFLSKTVKNGKFEILPPICKGTTVFTRKLYYESGGQESINIRLERIGKRFDFQTLTGKSLDYSFGYQPQVKLDEFGEPKEIHYPRTFTDKDRFTKPQPSGYYYKVKLEGELPLSPQALVQYAELRENIEKLNSEIEQAKLENDKVKRKLEHAETKLKSKLAVIEKADCRLRQILEVLKGKFWKGKADKELIAAIKESL